MRTPPSPSAELPSLDAPAFDQAAVVAALRARIARMSGGGGTRAEAIPLAPAIDQALPGGGLARGGVHEVVAAEPGAAAGFCALLLARAAAGGRGAVLWIAREPDAWPPGLARFGLSPADLVLVQAPRPQDGLWAMEESLRCPGVAAALLDLSELDMTAARRLQLAAEAGGALGLLLRPESAAGATAALSRWRVEALASSGGGHALGDPRWRLELQRCRGGRPGAWEVAWRPAAERLDVEGAERLDVEGAERLDVEAEEAEREVVVAPRRARRVGR